MSPPIKLDKTNDLEQIATSILLADEHLTIKYMNPSAEVLFQSSFKHIKNHHIKSIFQNYEYLEKISKKTIKTKNTYKEHNFPIFIKGNEKIITFSVTYSNEKDYKFVFEFIEMGQILKAAKEERMLIQQKANSELIRNLAHEIRNPLGGIKGAAQLLKQETHGKYTDFIDIMIQESSRLQKLMDNLMQPYKLPSFKKTNVHEILEKVRNSLSFEFKDIKFERDYDISVPEPEIDADKIFQAIYNLTRNACESIFKQKNNDDGRITIMTRAERKVIFYNKLHHTVLAISICDNGPGINKDIQEKIFFPLVSNKSDGTGIGLSIVQNFITLHNGMIDFTSTPGQTVFKILIPLEHKND